MAYQPGIPTGLVYLDEDYANLQENFSQLDQQFTVDHIPFSNTSGTPPEGINGYHQSIHFNPQSTGNPNYPPTIPAATPGYGQVFTVSDVDGTSGTTPDTQLYWLSGGGNLAALTRNFQPVQAQNGYTYLPGGLILQWAAFVAATATGTLSFNMPFPTACFIVVLQGDDNTTATQNLLVTSRSKPSFDFKSLNVGSSYTYTAIGY